MKFVVVSVLVSAVLGPFSCKSRSSSAIATDTTRSSLESSAAVTAIRDLSNFRCQSKSVKVAFFDADSTLRVSRDGGPAANSSDDVKLLPFVVGKIAELNASNTLVAVVSNQGGVGVTVSRPDGTKHTLTFEDVSGGLLEISKKIAAAGKLQGISAHVDYIDLAENKDEFRKADSGMARMLDATLQNKLEPKYAARLRDGTFKVDSSCTGASINWSESFMVGDAAYTKADPSKMFPGDPVPPPPYPRSADDFTNSDRLFAEKLGIAFYEPADFFGWWKYEVGNIISDKAKDSEKVFQNLRLSEFLAKLDGLVPYMDPAIGKAVQKDIEAVMAVNK